CVAAARVSLRREALSLADMTEEQITKDKGLLNRLIRDKHTSPFEHAVFQFRIRAPIFVVRQWMRHRFACLSGDTELYFDLPSAVARGQYRKHVIRLEDFHRRWHEGSRHATQKKKPLYLENVNPDKLYSYAQTQFEVTVPMRDKLSQMHLRMCDEETGKIRHTQVANVWQTGVKPVFRVTLENGYSINMTKDHRSLTEAGWMTLGEATGLRLTRRGNAAWRDNTPAFAVNGERRVLQQYTLSEEGLASIRAARSGEKNQHAAPRHRDKPSPSPRRLVRMYSQIKRIEYVGKEMTYDIEVVGPYHNFVANGFIVHNSYNEESGRYVKLIDEFYLPEHVRIRAGKAMDYRYEPIDDERNTYFRNRINDLYEEARALYEEMLEAGIAREHARMVLPVAQYTTFFWTVNTLSLMNFLNLRNSEHAQYEIRQYASVIEDIFAQKMPWTQAAFREHWGPSAIN
ncbi:MAG: FAD-dependent thymidylate synthase, partial [Anaerolineae bacterium]